MNLAEQLSEKIQSLQSALLENNPRMPVLLRDIHKLLKEDPEVVTLPDEDEIAIIISGLKRQTMTEIATTAAKSSPRKAIKNIGLADL